MSIMTDLLSGSGAAKPLAATTAKPVEAPKAKSATGQPDEKLKRQQRARTRTVLDDEKLGG